MSNDIGVVNRHQNEIKCFLASNTFLTLTFIFRYKVYLNKNIYKQSKQLREEKFNKKSWEGWPD
jgi:CTP:phosphocholine cytidylyltransferase-like protein